MWTRFRRGVADELELIGREGMILEETLRE